MNTRLYNARISPVPGDMDIIKGEVWVKGNRVYYAGKEKEPDIEFDREINLNGDLILPGFKNAHTHSAMTFLRSLADDMPLLEWLYKMIFPMEAKLKPEHAYFFNILAIMEYLTSGVTAIFDMYSFTEELARASIDCGFRTVICGTLSDRHGSIESMEEEYLRHNSTHPLVSHRLGFHAEYTCSKKLLEATANLACRYNAPMFTHNSESKKEVEECVARTGMTPTAYLDSLGLFEYGGGCFHCVHMTEDDFGIFKKRGLAAVVNPASNLKLGSGIAPVKTMLEHGIPVAIGTDGPASNNSLDMFREMFLVTALQKVREDDASAVPAADVINMACCTGAHVMGLDDCDCIAAGKLADLTVIDLHKPNMRPLHNIINNVVYSGSKLNVRLTMIDGVIRYENGVFNIGADPMEIYRKADEIAHSI